MLNEYMFLIIRVIIFYNIFGRSYSNTVEHETEVEQNFKLNGKIKNKNNTGLDTKDEYEYYEVNLPDFTTPNSHG